MSEKCFSKMHRKINNRGFPASISRSIYENKIYGVAHCVAWFACRLR